MSGASRTVPLGPRLLGHRVVSKLRGTVRPLLLHKRNTEFFFILFYLTSKDIMYIFIKIFINITCKINGNMENHHFSWLEIKHYILYLKLDILLFVSIIWLNSRHFENCKCIIYFYSIANVHSNIRYLFDNIFCILMYIIEIDTVKIIWIWISI